MALQVIPTDPVRPFWTQTTNLDGTPYFLTFRYNAREQVYYLSIDSADQSFNYVQGLKLVTNVPLLSSVGPTPPGELYVLTQSSDDDSPPGLGELGETSRCVLLYLPEADLFANGGEASGEPQRFSGFVV